MPSTPGSTVTHVSLTWENRTKKRGGNTVLLLLVTSIYVLIYAFEKVLPKIQTTPHGTFDYFSLVLPRWRWRGTSSHHPGESFRELLLVIGPFLPDCWESPGFLLPGDELVFF